MPATSGPAGASQAWSLRLGPHLEEKFFSSFRGPAGGPRPPGGVTVNDFKGLMGNSLLKWVTPNQLTLLRILLIPLILLFIYRGDPVSNWVAVGIFFLACLTDFLDGRLARFRGEVSPLGALLDPIADKMLISATLVMLVSQGLAPVIPTIVILLREFAVSGLRQTAAAQGVIIAAEPGAKWKTVFQMVAAAFHMVTYRPFSLPLVEIGQTMLWVAMVWTVWTGYSYFRRYFKTL